MIPCEVQGWICALPALVVDVDHFQGLVVVDLSYLSGQGFLVGKYLLCCCCWMSFCQGMLGCSKSREKTQDR